MLPQAKFEARFFGKFWTIFKIHKGIEGTYILYVALGSLFLLRVPIEFLGKLYPVWPLPASSCSLGGVACAWWRRGPARRCEAFALSRLYDTHAVHILRDIA